MESVSIRNNADDYNKWFLFTIIYLIVDYGRPQDVIPVVGYLRPGMIMILILTYFVTTKSGFRKSKSDQTRMLWYFVILTAIYIPFARNNYWAFQTARNMVSYVPFILSVAVCVNSVKRLKILINVLIGLMVYVAIYSLTHGGVGSGNYFQDENDVSLFVVMVLPFAFFLALHTYSGKMRIIYGLALIIGLSAIVVSFSRGGFLGLVCASAVMWYYSPKKIISLLLIGILGAGVYLFTGEAYKKEMSTVTDTKENTAHARILSWESAWKMFLDNPLGVGGNNFPIRFPEYQVDGFKKVMWGRAAHSLWFTLIPELGIFGVLIYFRMLLYNVKDIAFVKKMNTKNNGDVEYLRALSLALMSSLIGFFTAATFLSVLYYPHYWYLTGIIIVVAKLARRIDDGSNETEKSQKKQTSKINKKSFA